MVQVQSCRFRGGAGVDMQSWLQRCSKVQVQRCRGAEVQRCRDAEMQRCRGADVRRCRSALALRF